MPLAFVPTAWTINAQWSGAASYRDLYPYTRSLHCQHGISPDAITVNAGTCTIVLEDPNGIYDPENTSSPAYPYIVPGAAVTISCTGSFGTGYVFGGYVASITHDHSPLVLSTTIECVDAVDYILARTVLASGITLGSGTTGQAIQAIMTNAAPSMSGGASAGDTITPPVTDGTSTALSQIQALITPELGLFTINQLGQYSYFDRTYRYARQSGAAFPLGPGLIGSQKTNVDIATVTNSQKVTKTGSTTQSATNTTSITNYGTREGSAITSTYIASDTHALNIARFIVGVRGPVRGQAKTITVINDSAASLATIFTVFMFYGVSVTEPSGVTFEGWVHGMSLDVEIAQSFIKKSFTVIRQSPGLFTVGISTVGGNDVLGY